MQQLANALATEHPDVWDYIQQTSPSEVTRFRLVPSNNVIEQERLARVGYMPITYDVMHKLPAVNILYRRLILVSTEYAQNTYTGITVVADTYGARRV